MSDNDAMRENEMKWPEIVRDCQQNEGKKRIKRKTFEVVVRGMGKAEKRNRVMAKYVIVDGW